MVHILRSEVGAHRPSVKLLVTDNAVIQDNQASDGGRVGTGLSNALGVGRGDVGLSRHGLTG